MFILKKIPFLVRARKSPWIETAMKRITASRSVSGLVRARGLKHIALGAKENAEVRARKSPWIETQKPACLGDNVCQGS